MSTDNNQQATQVDIDLDEIFNGGASATNITLPTDETVKKSIFAPTNEKVDMSFADPENKDDDEAKEKVKADKFEKETEGADILKDLLTPEGEDEEIDTRGRKKITGISDVFTKLIKDEKIIPFDDEKSIEEYTIKDWEELIEANLEEKVNQARRETPKQFFESLPEELQIAARYVADGGSDLKGLFATLAQVEETKSLNVKEEKDQEYIIREYLNATGYGTPDEISEEIEVWKDLGKLEQQASKFKPKLDKMQEQIVNQKLQEQEMRKKQQQQASNQYMENVYNTLKDGQIGDVKIDKKVQSMLYNGLVQPNYPSVSGRNTNLLGHLLEKYQFVEPNYPLIAEALWLLQDPEGYKAKIMDKGAQKSVENTVRKLKTEQSNNSNSSLGVDELEEDNSRNKPAGRKIARTNNIFKRF
jgi:hypothetical protein